MASPKYQEIADDLRERLRTGVLPLEQARPGGPRKLAGEKELAAEYGASRSTIRLAIQLLVNQGLLQTRHGIGTYVLEPTPSRAVPLDQQEDWRVGEQAEAALKPAGEPVSAQRTTRFQAETVDVTGELAELLNVAKGSQVVLRRSHQHIGEKPWCLAVSYYPMDIASGTALEKAGSLQKSSSLVLAEIGHEPVRYIDRISARMPDAIETAFFRSVAVIPVIVVSRIAYDLARPVRLTRYIYRADQVQLIHEMSHTRAPQRDQNSSSSM